MAKTGNKVVRSFRPDFLLVRQNLRDAKDDYRNLLLGFKYGNIPSVNSLESIYQFQVNQRHHHIVLIERIALKMSSYDSLLILHVLNFRTSLGFLPT